MSAPDKDPPLYFLLPVTFIALMLILNVTLGPMDRSSKGFGVLSLFVFLFSFGAAAGVCYALWYGVVVRLGLNRGPEFYRRARDIALGQIDAFFQRFALWRNLPVAVRGLVLRWFSLLMFFATVLTVVLLLAVMMALRGGGE